MADILDTMFPSVETIKIKYLPGAAHMKQEAYGNWIDCHAYKDVALKKGEYGYVNLGFACQLPEGYEAHIVPRSSTFKPFGVIKKGERPCQFRIVKTQPKILFDEVIDLKNPNRSGFGSTGR